MMKLLTLFRRAPVALTDAAYPDRARVEGTLDVLTDAIVLRLNDGRSVHVEFHKDELVVSGFSRMGWSSPTVLRIADAGFRISHPAPVDAVSFETAA